MANPAERRVQLAVSNGDKRQMHRSKDMARRDDHAGVYSRGRRWWRVSDQPYNEHGVLRVTMMDLPHCIGYELCYDYIYCTWVKRFLKEV